MQGRERSLVVRPQLRRAEWTSLNGPWRFAFDDDGRLRERTPRDDPPRRKQMTKAVFGTAWDGHYILTSTAAGMFSARTQQGEAIAVGCAG